MQKATTVPVWSVAFNVTFTRPTPLPIEGSGIDRLKAAAPPATVGHASAVTFAVAKPSMLMSVSPHVLKFAWKRSAPRTKTSMRPTARAPATTAPPIVPTPTSVRLSPATGAGGVKVMLAQEAHTESAGPQHDSHVAFFCARVGRDTQERRVSRRAMSRNRAMV